MEGAIVLGMLHTRCDILILKPACFCIAREDVKEPERLSVTVSSH